MVILHSYVSLPEGKFHIPFKELVPQPPLPRVRLVRLQEELPQGVLGAEQLLFQAVVHLELLGTFRSNRVSWIQILYIHSICKNYIYTVYYTHVETYTGTFA